MAREQLGTIINLTLPGGTVVQAVQNSPLHYAYARMGATPAPAGVQPDPYPGSIDDSDVDLKVSQLLTGSGFTAKGLRAALGSADPVVSMTYNPDGTVATSTEDGVTTTFTYNADGTVATTKRGTGPTRTYSYTSGNLVSVA